MKRINYVVAGWTGQRRAQRCGDGIEYLLRHLDSLQRYKHRLSQITVVLPENPLESAGAREQVAALDGTAIEQSPVRVLRRENVGLSYGSYSHCYGIYTNEFEYYLFMEDDYVFARDDFDETMIELFNSKENCGFLCGLVGLDRGRRHAAISNGITRHDILAKVWNEFGRLPHHVSGGYSSAGQVQFSQAFEQVGYRLDDFTDSFKSPFYEWSTDQIIEHAPHQTEYLIKPIQMI